MTSSVSTGRFRRARGEAARPGRRRRKRAPFYWTFPPYRRRGYATRAARVLAEWALGELGVERIEVHVEPDNVASRRVADRAGFRETGETTEDGLLVYACQPGGW